MYYREIPHKCPAPGTELPVFIVSVYSGGDMLLYSHGGFDIWCVYHAVKVGVGPSYLPPTNDDYPLTLSTIRVRELTGTQTDFTGSFSPSVAIEYMPPTSRHEYDLPSYSFDAPEDIDYMQDVRDLAESYGRDRVWRSFLSLYDCIPHVRGVKISRAMTGTVLEIASDYPREHNLRFTLDCLLCAMIAENNRLKKYGSKYDTRLGKKVKALGVYQAIYETNLSIRQVADYSKHRNWRWISEECRRRGITTPDF